MDPLLIKLCRKLARQGSHMVKWGQDLFFDNNPTYEEYLEFRKGRTDLRVFTKEVFENFVRERNDKKQKEENYGQQNKG